MVSHVRNGQWTSDFWEHSAAVRELATHPFSPHHPQLAIDAPHAFYTPYTVGVAWISRLTGLDAIASLSMVAIANLLLFLAAVRWFVPLLLEADDATPAFYALLFTLVLWGPEPWTFSGFLNRNALGYTLPYPSTFATELTLVTWSACILYLRHRNRVWLGALAALATVVILSHPITGIVMYVGLGALVVNKHGARLHSDYVVFAGVCALSFLAALAWPYFSFLELASSQSAVFHVRNQDMYTDVWTRTFPALLGIPLLIGRMKRIPRDWLGLTAAGLGLVYAYGYVSERWSYGRVIPAIVFVLHIGIADWAARREGSMMSRLSTLTRNTLAVAGLVVFSAYLVTNYRSGLAHSFPGRPARYSDYLFLARHTSQSDVILADMATSFIVPTIGGKVVAARHPLAFVQDQEIRRRDVLRCFEQSTDGADRVVVIRKYGARFLLLNNTIVPHSRQILDSLPLPTRLVAEQGPLTLVELDRGR